ncbi:CAP domain-containing protein [Catenulispora pinisilvae]|uniref:CAP domain-containing protein n=1 Tax=Catenulispora pinisilvae TaxID=2705253 RepID=UPI0018910A04|nr:CAP domain-containing protein [Catenulispora pinisilvae]
MVALTNDQRVAHGCPALRDDSRLRAAAIGHSVDMRARDYFAHNTPDGVTPWTRIEAKGYSDPSAENIAMGQATPQAVVDAWMNSPGHRTNILSCSSKAIGVGVQFGPNGPWWTQDFGYS